MSHIKLRSGDIALLERLNYEPFEIGDLPPETVERLMALGLVRKVLGCCEITHQGQLTVHRQHFLKASRRRVARVTRRNPMFLSEERYGASGSRARLSDHLKSRRLVDSPGRGSTLLPKWLSRLATETAGRFRSIDVPSAGSGGRVQPNLKREPHQGSK